MEEDQTFKTCSLLRNEILTLYNDAKIIQSFNKLNELENIILNEEKQLKNDYLDHPISKLYKMSFLTFQSIKREHAEVQSLLERFNTEECWDKVVSNKNGIKTMFKKNADSPLFSVRVDSVINTNIFNILAILMEIDLYTRWVPSAFGAGLKDVQVFKDLDRFKKLAHFKCGLPFPFTNRDCVIYGYGVDLLEEENKILAIVRSVDDMQEEIENINEEREQEENLEDISTIENALKEGLNIPKETSSYVRILVKEGGFLLTPIDDNSSTLSFIFTADPKMSYIPSYLINWGLKFSANYAMQTLITTSLNIDEVYQERMAQKSDVYEYLKKRLEEHKRNEK